MQPCIACFFEKQIALARDNVAAHEQQTASLGGDSEAMYTSTMIEVRSSSGFEDHFAKMAGLDARTAQRVATQDPADSVCRLLHVPNKSPVPLQRSSDILEIHAGGNTILPRFRELVDDIAGRTGCTFNIGTHCFKPAALFWLLWVQVCAARLARHPNAAGARLAGRLPITI